jgi:hypothetical protein
VDGNFRLTYDEHGVTGLANPHDPFDAELLAPGQRLGLRLRYRNGETNWSDLAGTDVELPSHASNDRLIYTRSAHDSPLKLTQTFRTDGQVLDWDIDLETSTNRSVEIGDLAITIPAASPRGEDPKQIFEHGFLKHQFVSGNGSFLYFVRASVSTSLSTQPATGIIRFAPNCFWLENLLESNSSAPTDDLYF